MSVTFNYESLSRKVLTKRQQLTGDVGSPAPSRVRYSKFAYNTAIPRATHHLACSNRRDGGDECRPSVKITTNVDELSNFTYKTGSRKMSKFECKPGFVVVHLPHTEEAKTQTSCDQHLVSVKVRCVPQVHLCNTYA